MTHGRIASSFALAVLLATLSGCANTTIKGRVIPGEIGRVLIVPISDERMEEPGVADAEVTIRQGGVLAKGKTTGDGGFSFSVRDDTMRSGPIQVLVEGDSIFRVQNQVQIPSDGQAILVNAVRRTPSENEP
ncbi:MAG: hypothetical protein ACF8Q5_14055 [Phycisphaerales bacterium JB040]